MIPIPAPLLLVWKYRKLAGYALAAVAVVLLVWRIAAWREGYQKLAVVEKSLTAEKAARKSDFQRYTVETARSQAERERFQADLTAIRAKFAAMPVPAPKTLIRTVEVPIAANQTTCPAARVSADFVRHWNEAGNP